MFVVQFDITVLNFLIMNHFTKQSPFFQKQSSRNIEFEILGMEEQFRNEHESESSTNFEDVISYVSIKFFEGLTFIWSIVKSILVFFYQLITKKKSRPFVKFALAGIIIYIVFGGISNSVETSSEPAVITKKEELPKGTESKFEMIPTSYSKKIVIASPEPKRLNHQQNAKVLAYIDRFENVAKTEMNKFGIPASIKMAQALLETNVGSSKLCLKNNNHFGIKCFSKVCSHGHCANMSDDHHKDFFRKYATSWESWRDHSKFLNRDRYVHLQEYGNDYKKWAKGLQKAGYATDKNYSKKLIKLIEKYRLYELDDYQIS